MLLRSKQITRCLHSSRRLLQEATQAAVPTLGKGKKIKPEKQSLVILNARESNIFKNRNVPKYFQDVANDQTPFNLDQDESLKLLNLGRNGKKLTKDESFKVIEQYKPRKNAISKKRYEQLSNQVSKVFTIQQMKNYIKDNYAGVEIGTKVTKSQLLQKLVIDSWKVEINDLINPEEDLIVERVFDLSPKELFLLLWKRPFDDWIRADVEIIVFPEELRVIVKATKPYLQYIEISIDRILKNIKEEYVSLDKIMEISKDNKVDVPILDIQRLSGVFLEKHKLENDEIEEGEDNYNMFAFGNKPFSDFRRLIIWSLEHNSFIKSTIHADFTNPKYKYFNLFTDGSLPWIYRRKQWLRLKEPKSLDSLPQPINLDTDKIYEELYSSTIKPSSQSITAVSLGHLLFRESSKNKDVKKFIMNTNIPFAHKRILKLPLFRPEEDDEFDSETLIDHHSYFAQLKFLPSPYDNSNNFTKFPPVEFWFEIDERESAKKSTLQVLSVSNERNSIVSLPSYPTDVKFIKSDSELLIQPSDGSDSWLSDQPGVKAFLENAKLDFSGKTKVKVPDFVEIGIQGVETPIRYDYVSLAYRRHLDLDYKGKLLQFAVIEGGALGGRTSEIIIIGKDGEMDKEEFKNFTDETIEFVKSLN